MDFGLCRDYRAEEGSDRAGLAYLSGRPAGDCKCLVCRGQTMNVLVLTNNPHRPSFRQRIGVYIGPLRRRGINCEVACFGGGVLARHRLLKRSRDFDVVFLHKKRLNFLEAPLLRRFARRLIYDFDDAVMYRASAPGRFNLSGQMRFRLTVGLADLVIAGNAYLAGHARRYNKSVEVLPTGLETRAYRAARQAVCDGQVRLVWIGSKSTLRYLQQIRPALEEIGRRFGNVVLRIICDEFIELQDMKVEQCRWSQQTEIKDLAGGDIGLAPLPDNRFTRGKCGFKILQYASVSLPVVASPVGVNSEYVRDGVTGFLASTAEEWIERTSRLIEDAQLRAEMGANALREVERFDVDVIGDRLAGLIERCAGGVKS